MVYSSQRTPRAADTTAAAEERQLAVLRRYVPEQRLALLGELSAFALASARAALRRTHPLLDDLARARLLAAYQWGESYAARILYVPSVEGPMLITAAIEPVAQTLDALAVPYAIGGSVASSAYSIPRTTYDVDIVADLQVSHIGQWVQRLQPLYYVDGATIVDALAQRSSFNMTHHATGINIDIFIPLGRAYDEVQFQRAQSHLLPGGTHPVKLVSPEDVVLNKLAWYELGNRVSDVQWRDVQGLLRVQGSALDQAYMTFWAAALGLADLLAAALRGERPLPPSDPPQQQPLF